jgi:hypothetical protein
VRGVIQNFSQLPFTKGGILFADKLSMIFLYYNPKPNGKTDRGSAKTAGREGDYSLRNQGRSSGTSITMEAHLWEK